MVTFSILKVGARAKREMDLIKERPAPEHQVPRQSYQARLSETKPERFYHNAFMKITGPPLAGPVR